MKKAFCLLTAIVVAMFVTVSCGPTAKQIEEKRVNDSIRVADSLAKIAADTTAVIAPDTTVTVK